MNLHTYEAKTVFGDFIVAVKASECSRADAITVAMKEFGGLSTRVLQNVATKRKLPAEAAEVKCAKGWAWVWRKPK